jgi:hypothetical protein
MRTIVKLMLVISILVTVGCNQIVTAKSITEAERLCKEFGGVYYILTDPMSTTRTKQFHQVTCINDDYQFTFSVRR